jgi:hypothetical protein
VVLEELDVEISLRERLARTIQARLAWAAAIKASLSVEGEQTSIELDFSATKSSAALPLPESVDFRTNALEVLDTIESECDIIFARPLKFATPHEPPIPLLQHHASQQLSRSSRARAPTTRANAPTAQLLFIRDDGTSPPTVAKMVCPGCGRSNFPSMQGLLNHCRLAHQQHYGNHDECMQACAAVIASAEERDWTVAHGIEIGGIARPSVRRLFEIAVGRADAMRLLGRDAVQGEPQAAGGPAPNTHLSQTLGHHEDTPALAPFLGRTPVRRCINVHDDGQVVDITEGLEDDIRHEAKAWRMAYHHRSSVAEETDETNEVPIGDEGLLTGPVVPTEEYVMPPTGQSRFHMVARIVVADRSLWIPPGEVFDVHHYGTLTVMGRSSVLSAPGAYTSLDAFCRFTLVCKYHVFCVYSSRVDVFLRAYTSHLSWHSWW